MKNCFVAAWCPMVQANSTAESQLTHSYSSGMVSLENEEELFSPPLWPLKALLGWVRDVPLLSGTQAGRQGPNSFSYKKHQGLLR